LARNAAEEFYLLQTVSIVSTGSREGSRQSFADRSGWSTHSPARNKSHPAATLNTIHKIDRHAAQLPETLYHRIALEQEAVPPSLTFHLFTLPYQPRIHRHNGRPSCRIRSRPRYSSLCRSSHNHGHRPSSYNDASCRWWSSTTWHDLSERNWCIPGCKLFGKFGMLRACNVRRTISVLTQSLGIQLLPSWFGQSFGMGHCRIHRKRQ
jgi:hypothetical protein